ncbi:hypothetical protein QAD02_010291 [Eretmocerus hayati]|uniref:Uncharacterized protein n=1 Tax=Eretmocerus hayati TaxID=131215 RepID=A0ACC2NCW9_9HYME|nr:hypothetical protein QAD02_010291 [Eretmocerus hayati]
MTSSGKSTAQLAAELKKSVRSRSARSVITGLRDNLDGVDFTPLKEVDITDPILLEPFKYGWKRELTYRASLSQQVADVYYHPPEKYRLLHQLSKASEKSQLIKKKTAGGKLSKNEIRKWTSITRGRALRSNVEVAEFCEYIVHSLDETKYVSINTCSCGSSLGTSEL